MSGVIKHTIAKPSKSPLTIFAGATAIFPSISRYKISVVADIFLKKRKRF